MTYKRMLGVDPVTDIFYQQGTRVQPRTGTLVKPPEPPGGTVGTMEKTTTVRAVQDLLRDHGLCVRADGVYGNETRTALVNFAGLKGVPSTHRGSGREIHVANPLWQALTARATPGVSCPTGGGTAPPAPPLVDEELDLDDRRPFLDTMREVPWWTWALVAAALGFTGWRVYVARKRRRAARAMAPNRRSSRSGRRATWRRRGPALHGVSWMKAGRVHTKRFRTGLQAHQFIGRLVRKGDAYNITQFDGAKYSTSRKRKTGRRGTRRNPTYRRRHYALPKLRRI